MSRRDVPLTVAAKALEKAIRLLKQEAEAATLEALSAKDGIVVLSGIDPVTAKLQDYWLEHLEWKDSAGYCLVLHRERFEPESWAGKPHMAGRWRPGQWDVRETRKDGKGRIWNCNLGAHITDDFGDLVPVEGGATC